MLAEIWKTTPFMALLLMAGLALVPDDLLKAASMDGATRWQRFIRVMLPVMKPAILVALLFRTLDAFRVFDNIYVLTAGANETSSVSMLAYNNLIRGLNLGIGIDDVGADLHHGRDHRVRLREAVRHRRTWQRRRGEALMAGPGNTDQREGAVGRARPDRGRLRADPGAVDRVAVVQDDGDADRRQLHPARVDAGQLPARSSRPTSSSGR